MFESEHTQLPRNMVDLVCCLQENALDDDSIIDICMRLYGQTERIDRLILFLSLGYRTAGEIESYAEGLS